MTEKSFTQAFINLTVQEVIDRSYATALEKGWWDESRTVGDIIALAHSELSEALEEYRLNGATAMSHIAYNEAGFTVDRPPVIGGGVMELG